MPGAELQFPGVRLGGDILSPFALPGGEMLQVGYVLCYNPVQSHIKNVGHLFSISYLVMLAHVLKRM